AFVTTIPKSYSNRPACCKTCAASPARAISLTGPCQGYIKGAEFRYLGGCATKSRRRCYMRRRSVELSLVAVLVSAVSLALPTAKAQTRTSSTQTGQVQKTSWGEPD